jgi:agmatine deiminase
MNIHSSSHPPAAVLAGVLFAASLLSCSAQTALSRFPDETETHEGTWLTWPHHYTYGTGYRNSLDATWVAMVRALTGGERVHIIAYNATEQTRITNLLNAAGAIMTQVDFFLRQSDDVWIRDNGPIFVVDGSGTLKITDWGFDGWGDDTPYAKDDTVPAGVSSALNLPRVNLAAIVLEGGAIEHDGDGTMLATRSSTLDSARNPGVSQAQFEDALRKQFGFTRFIWLAGAFGGQEDITDMHIDGFARFAPGRRLVTMSNADLAYWGVSAADITRLTTARDSHSNAYAIVRLPLTANDVRTTNGTSLGYKGSYVNYYVANKVVLVPAYNDSKDAVARALIAPLYPGRAVVGIDVRNLYSNGGMVHCVTQQQPAVPLRLSCTPSAANTITLRFSGNPLHRYKLQASPDLRTNTWNDLESFTLSGQFRDMTKSTVGYNRRFYRVARP